MDKQGIAELNILEEIQVDGQCSQRELARRSGLGLSYLNIYLKGLVRKGYVSVRDMSGRRLWYNLTPSGITEKARMTLEYMKWSLGKYRDIRERVNVVCQELRQENRLDLVICGVSDAAEIFYLGALEAGLGVVAVVDDARIGESWLNIPVMKIDSLKNDITCDFIIIGDIENCFELASRLSELSIPDDRYRVCTGQRIRAVSVLEVTDQLATNSLTRRNIFQMFWHPCRKPSSWIRELQEPKRLSQLIIWYVTQGAELYQDVPLSSRVKGRTGNK